MGAAAAAEAAVAGVTDRCPVAAQLATPVLGTIECARIPVLPTVLETNLGIMRSCLAAGNTNTNTKVYFFHGAWYTKSCAYMAGICTRARTSRPLYWPNPL